MAANKRFMDGEKLYLPVSAGTVSGSPVFVGNRGGVALTDRDGANSASVDLKGVYRLTVTGAVANVGDAVYYLDDANPALRINSDATGRQFFGYALEQKGGAAAEIDVLIGEASGISDIALLGVTTGMLADGAVGEAKLADPAVPGLHAARVARAIFDPTNNAGERAIDTHGLGVTIPANAIILRGIIEVTDAFTDAAGASRTSIQAEAAEDLLADSAVGALGVGLVDVIPVGTAATAVQTTVARELSVRVVDAELTAGTAIIFVEYVVSE